MTSDSSSLESRCLCALREAWRRGIESPRSPRKLDVLHGWIRQELLRELTGYKVYGKTTKDGRCNQERVVDGKYYQKRVDIVVARDQHEIGAISVKLIQSSYKKNAINYFEHQLGETANLRRQRLVYGNVIFLPHPIPVTSRGQRSEEYLTDASLDRYRKLVADHDSIVVPDVQAIVIPTLDRQTGELSRLATRDDLEHLSLESLDFLFGRVHITKFIRDYTTYVTTSFQQMVD